MVFLLEYVALLHQTRDSDAIKEFIIRNEICFVMNKVSLKQLMKCYYVKITIDWTLFVFQLYFFQSNNQFSRVEF